MSASATPIDYASLAERFLRAQLAGDRREALRIVVDEGVSRGARVIDVQAYVIRSAQHEIGRLWQANKINIAQEHLASGISQFVMARLFEHVEPVPRNGKSVAVACVEGEQHDLPARLVADYLEHAGFMVRYYGANVPNDDLVKLVQLDAPSLLALSVTMSFNVAALRAAVARVRAEASAELPILIGGHAIEMSTSLVDALGARTAPPSPDELVDVVRSLTRAS